MIRPITKKEVLYCYPNSTEISSKTGFVGLLKVYIYPSTDLNVRWKTYREDLYSSSDINKEINKFLDTQMGNGFLSGRKAFENFCDSTEVFQITDWEYGIREDSPKYAYLMRLCTDPDAEDHVYVYVYVKDWLDKHIQKANRKGIRFIDSHYNTLFYLEDGESIVIEDVRGFRTPKRVCRYVDDYHVEVGTNIFHICEFAGLMENNHNKVIPLRSSLPEQCYIYVQTENKIGVVKKGESGYYKTDILECNGIKSHSEAKAFVNELNCKIDVTPAQCKAMMAGSMFGWHTLAADPHNYNDNGTLKKPKE